MNVRPRTENATPTTVSRYIAARHRGRSDFGPRRLSPTRLGTMATNVPRDSAPFTTVMLPKLSSSSAALITASTMKHVVIVTRESDPYSSTASRSGVIIGPMMMGKTPTTAAAAQSRPMLPQYVAGRSRRKLECTCWPNARYPQTAMVEQITKRMEKLAATIRQNRPASRSFISPYMGSTHIWMMTDCIIALTIAMHPVEKPK
mmetsp:Transcript_84120/g.238639  ORF Transcript_84120/g.238639 Transcript_84120/m.238639 type:complete len:203 (-) Transcript_84120:350-958(-)